MPANGIMQISLKQLPRILFVVLVCFVGFFPDGLRAQDKTNQDSQTLSAETLDKDQCARNLKLIYSAIQAYRTEHKETPRWLSDLVPQYINNPSVFICPGCERARQYDTSISSDSKLATTYDFLFSPTPLGKDIFANGNLKTQRELSLKLYQTIGTIVPMVRCAHHHSVLNLSYGGDIFDSPNPSDLPVIAAGTAVKLVPLTEPQPETIASNQTPVLPELALQPPLPASNTLKTKAEAPTSAKTPWLVIGIAVVVVLNFFLLVRIRSKVTNISNFPVLRAQALPDGTPLTGTERDGLIAMLGQWMRQKLFQKLIADRAQLVANQQAATLAVMKMEERLILVEKDIKERNQQYEKRIDDLLKELARTQEENRELLRSKIESLKSEAEKSTDKTGKQPPTHRN